MRILAAVLLAASGLFSAAAAVAPAEVRAAAPGLTLVTAATYDVRPDQRRVAVSVHIAATNTLHDTVTKRYYFDVAYLAVLPSTKGYAIASNGASPKVSVAARKKDYTLLKISFGRRLGGGSTMALDLTFDLVDPGGVPDRPVRITPSLVSFFAWAYASDSTPGSTVAIRMPAGYTVTVGRGPMDGPKTDASGGQVWTSGRLATPLTFIADVNADKPGGYASTTEKIPLGSATATVDIESWPDDPEWGTRVGALVTRGLPHLAEEIGLPWPFDTPLRIQETLVRTTGGYAGLFDPATGHVQVAYAADGSVVLHEAAHAWFNGSLIADRWVAEAFASYYAGIVGPSSGVKGSPPVLTDALRKAAFPLNAWGAVGTSHDDTEAYGYAASLTLARAIAERAGADGLRTVWRAASDRVGAYQPSSGPVEKVSAAPDWRGLLDLLEETGTSYADLWRTWVARPDDVPLLDARAAARADYTALVAKAGTWRLPAPIRAAMRTWQFTVAERSMAEASSVLEQRAQLERDAAAAGLTLPDALRLAFESDAGPSAATDEAGAERAALETLVTAAAARPPDPGPIERLGLVGTEPETDLAGAKADFAKGELATAATLAGRAETAWKSASDIGRGRLVSIVLLLVAAALATFLVVRRVRSMRRREG